MKVSKRKFGVLCDGTKVNLYTVSNSKMSFSCMEYGCTITSIVLNQKNGEKNDILLGYSTLEGYLNSTYCFGAIVGRFANRIAKASFELNGQKYNLDKNDGPNTLHGGFSGYDKMLWSAKEIKEKHYAGVKFSRLSPDGEQGFPGNLKLTVSYILDDKNNLTCLYTAQSDAATPINITNHAYFNLEGNGSVENHLMKMNALGYLEVNDKLIPTGKIIDAKGSAFDFSSEHKIGQNIKATGLGYDHCYVTEIYNPENKTCAIPTEDSDLVDFCTVRSEKSGNVMDVYTNMEGCQFYTGNFIKGIQGKNGRIYQNHDAFCLETQAFPDSPNKSNFPSCILEPEQKMKAKTIYSFTIG